MIPLDNINALADHFVEMMEDGFESGIGQKIVINRLVDAWFLTLDPDIPSASNPLAVGYFSYPNITSETEHADKILHRSIVLNLCEWNKIQYREAQRMKKYQLNKSRQ